MTKKTDVNFSDFLHLFEEVKPPILIAEETIDHIKNIVKPIPQSMIDNFILRWEEQIDEYTEFIPCFALPATKEYRAIIYWKASILKYEYILITTDPQGTMIGRKPICGTMIENDIVKKSVAKIDEDLIIHIQAGAAYDTQEYDVSHGQSFSIEIMESGDLLFNIDNQAEEL